jgi:DeoR/GlpR family transcriptional regulator of sugar metabolism
MLGSKRKGEIVERVRRDGSVIAAELAVEWNVSEDTIRRDLRDLAAEGKVHRVHGGAVPLSPAAADYATRTTVASVEKAAVARAAAAMIKTGQTVFLDGGTTTAAICHALSPALEATIVTHSPTVAAALVEHLSIRVLLIGGMLYRHSVVTVGALALEYVNSVSVDLFFMGVSGVHQTHGLTTGDAEEAAMKRAISRRAGDTFVLASSEKLGSALPHHVVGFNEVTAGITDERDARKLKGLRRAGLQIIQASS